VSAAALALYDMAKGVDRAIVVEEIVLLEKSGGPLGPWRARGPGPRMGPHKEDS
jgi:cyclic pyranopterin phosphate synthase